MIGICCARCGRPIVNPARSGRSDKGIICERCVHELLPRGKVGCMTATTELKMPINQEDLAEMIYHETRVDEVGVSVTRIRDGWMVAMQGGGTRVGHNIARAMIYYRQCRKWSE